MAETQIELIYRAVKHAAATLPAENYKSFIDGVTNWCMHYVSGYDFLMIVAVLSKNSAVISELEASEDKFTQQVGFIYEAAANGSCAIPTEYLQPLMCEVTNWCNNNLGNEEWKKRIIQAAHDDWVLRSNA